MMPLPCLEKEKWIHAGMAGFQFEIISIPNDVFYTAHFNSSEGIFEKEREKGRAVDVAMVECSHSMNNVPAPVKSNTHMPAAG